MSRPLYGANFTQAIKRYFKGYVKFDGRASRSEYWFATLFQFAVMLVPMLFVIVGAIIMGATASYDPYTYETVAPSPIGGILMFLGWGLYSLIALGMFLPSLAIAWRRLHDGNFSGVFYLLVLVIGSFVLIFMALPSKAEGRRFDSAVR